MFKIIKKLSQKVFAEKKSDIVEKQ